ncbi:hypothetical protein DFH06DRAFT_1293184 [Mycena polygramma]|nr:hypothetical protein DFH06DRAFT_1293184 [Mycena polygramma]
MPGSSPFVGAATGGKAARVADRARLADLDAQIIALESSLNSLKEKRKSVQDRLDAYAYPVLTLPNEIASEIFVHFLPIYPKCPPPIGLLSPYLLCQICRKWRHIAFATPALWRAILLPWQRLSRRKQALRLMETSLEHSGSCLLSIELRGNSVAQIWKLTQFGRTIAEHCARLEHLALSVISPLEALPIGDLPLPSLRTLRLGWDIDNSTASTTFLGAPLLQKVYIHMYRDAHRSIFPWSQLTVLSVHWIPPNQCAEIMTQLVNIVYCEFRMDESEQNFDASCTLSHLETLILKAYQSPLQGSILRTLNLPALRRLHVPRFFTDPAALKSFVSRSGCNLEELCIPNADAASRLDYRAALPSVATFIFDSNSELTTTEPFVKESLYNPSDNPSDAESSSDGYHSTSDESESGLDTDSEEGSDSDEEDGSDNSN